MEGVAGVDVGSAAGHLLGMLETLSSILGPDKVVEGVGECDVAHLVEFLHTTGRALGSVCIAYTSCGYIFP